jgi:hypothetical protein
VQDFRGITWCAFAGPKFPPRWKFGLWGQKATFQQRQSDGTFVPADKTWLDYCNEIGYSRQRQSNGTFVPVV